MQDEDGRITASFVNLSHLCLFKKKNEPLMMETPSLGIRTGLKIPSSSSSSCPCWPVLSPCSCSAEPPFSRLLGLFRLVPLAVAGPAPPSSCFPERWMSLCLCERKRRALRGERWAPPRVRPAARDLIRYLANQHPSCHGEPGAGGEVWRDHDPQAGLREGQLVGVEDEELVHHHRRGRLLAVGLAWQRVRVQSSV